VDGAFHRPDQDGCSGLALDPGDRLQTLSRAQKGGSPVDQRVRLDRDEKMRFVSLNYLSETVKLNCIVDGPSTCRHMAFEIMNADLLASGRRRVIGTC
jgi:hypothetical protein